MAVIDQFFTVYILIIAKVIEYPTPSQPLCSYVATHNIHRRSLHSEIFQGIWHIELVLKCSLFEL